MGAPRPLIDMTPKRSRRSAPLSRQVLRERALSRFLERNAGVISSAELRQLEFDSQAVARLIVTRRLISVHKGVYRDGATALSVESACRCSLLAAGPTSLLGLESAAHRQGLLQFPPDRPQVVVPTRKRVRDRAGFDVHRFPGLAASDVIVVSGSRSTAPARTVLDLAAAARKEHQRRAVRRALREAVKLDPSVAPRLRAEVDGAAPFAGCVLLADALDDNLLGTLVQRSTLEEEFREFCRIRGLPDYEANAMVEGKEVDVLWRLQRVIWELDTFDHHGDELAFESDRARDAFLRDRNWEVSRLTGRRLRREPDLVEHQIRRQLGLI